MTQAIRKVANTWSQEFIDGGTLKDEQEDSTRFSPAWIAVIDSRAES
jgi:hypothetical protein